MVISQWSTPQERIHLCLPCKYGSTGQPVLSLLALVTRKPKAMYVHSMEQCMYRQIPCSDSSTQDYNDIRVC